MHTTELPKVKKIYYMSDLHIDSYPEQDVLDLPYHPDDGLILLGDYSNSFNVTAQYISSLANRFKWIIFILGNHDYYNNPTGLKATSFIHEVYPYPENVHPMDCHKTFSISDWAIIGDTLWTDYFDNNPLEKMTAQSWLSDFRYIIKGSEQNNATPDDFLEAHRQQLGGIKTLLNEMKDKKVILCTHHGVSKQSSHPRYKSSPINGSFVSDLDYLFLDYPNIEYALHGHCHDVFRYKINNTKVRCNPLGYNRERNITLREYYQTLDYIKL